MAAQKSAQKHARSARPPTSRGRHISDMRLRRRKNDLRCGAAEAAGAGFGASLAPRLDACVAAPAERGLATGRDVLLRFVLLPLGSQAVEALFEAAAALVRVSTAAAMAAVCFLISSALSPSESSV